ncbi:MAG TPA: 4-hydroxy-tetrahydrodipicolinate reductase [Puia sp.]|jgi:4-hydroxy-tetrahydrodipicolinate reductase|nr:4-hydroxy-tetrahydrodipicolinate reductase [Puia sp.]
MKIALIGYGKMGKAIEEVAVQRGHEIVLKIDIGNLSQFNDVTLAKANVAIEFTTPHTAFQNIMTCLHAKIPVVSGTTGWLNKFDEVKKYCADNNGAFLYTSNFSIGVNILFEINKTLAKLMAKQEEYKIDLTEIHHTEKRDAPSGTAITLAEQILENIPRKKKWVNNKTDDAAELEIISERIDPAAGTHKVKYSSSIDDIEIIHTAHSRKGFATGAVVAAEFLQNKKGIFSMKDVLGL